MLYYLIRLAAVFTLERFFHKIVVENREKIDDNRPTIYVANHPNTIMDALIVGYAVGKRIHFVARSGLVSSRLGRWFLFQLGMVPIYRRQDDPSNMEKNVQVFRELYRHLESGRSFLIFPEGVSEPARRLQKVKTGTARIAFGAEEENDFTLGVQIVPVGLNYSGREEFRSDVYCRFGRPIEPADYHEQYRDDPTQAVKELTHEIRAALERLTTYVQEENLDEFVSCLEQVYKKELIVNLGMNLKSKKDDFFATKGIIDAVRWFYDRQPDRVRKMERKIRKYLRTLNRLHLRDEFFSPKRRGVGFLKRLRAWFFLVLGFPLYFWGVANNYVPYMIPRWIARRFISQETSVSSAKLFAGLGSFVIFYSLQTWLCWLLFHRAWIASAYVISLVPSGNFALYYVKRASGYRQHLVFLSIFYRRRRLIYNLIRERMKLIESLDSARDEYLAGITPDGQTGG